MVYAGVMTSRWDLHAEAEVLDAPCPEGGDPRYRYTKLGAKTYTLSGTLARGQRITLEVPEAHVPAIKAAWDAGDDPWIDTYVYGTCEPQFRPGTVGAILGRVERPGIADANLCAGYPPPVD